MLYLSKKQRRKINALLFGTNLRLVWVENEYIAITKLTSMQRKILSGVIIIFIWNNEKKYFDIYYDAKDLNPVSTFEDILDFIELVIGRRRETILIH